MGQRRVPGTEEVTGTVRGSDWALGLDQMPPIHTVMAPRIKLLQLLRCPLGLLSCRPSGAGACNVCLVREQGSEGL
jgi:hypothetical protein